MRWVRKWPKTHQHQIDAAINIIRIQMTGSDITSASPACCYNGSVALCEVRNVGAREQYVRPRMKAAALMVGKPGAGIAAFRHRSRALNSGLSTGPTQFGVDPMLFSPTICFRRQLTEYVRTRMASYCKLRQLEGAGATRSQRYVPFSRCRGSRFNSRSAHLVEDLGRLSK